MARPAPAKLTPKQKERLKDPKFGVALRAVKPLIRQAKRQRKLTP
jgi:hypothetical protein